MQDFKKQLKATLEEYQSAEKIKRHLNKLDKRLDTETKELASLALALDKENKDYEELEKLSIRSIFHKVLGSKEEQMEKEKQEYLQASLKYDEAKKAIELLEYERKILLDKLDTVDGNGPKLQILLDKRERQLILENGPAGKKIQQIVNRLDEQEHQHKEIQEVVAAGKSALAILNQMAGYLQKARDWGTWNVGGRRGRGGMSSHIKHSSIDNARRLAPQARHQLVRFEDELRDIYRDVQQFQFSLSFDSFSRFSDIFFDNLISDFIVQQKIQNSLSNVLSVRDKVHRMAGGLQAKLPQIQNEIAQLEEQRNQLIVNS